MALYIPVVNTRLEMFGLFKKKASKTVAPVETARLEVPPDKSPLPVTYEEISLRAYQHWLSRGGTHGYDRDDWFTAEQELVAKR